MKALFLTTKTADCENHVRAWNSFSDIPAAHITFDPQGIRNSWFLLEAARELQPDVIFYIGAHKAPGNPKAKDLAEIKRVAPFINLCSDAVDKPWHPVLQGYANRECFDLQVAIDGAKNSPAGLATLTPVDPRPFDRSATKDIRCGFSGTVGRWNARSEIVLALKWFGGLTVRERGGAYEEHTRFMSRCKMILNISRSGTGHADHIKGRVMEAGFAGCCLLESGGSPIGEWFPDDCYFMYDSPIEASKLIAGLTDGQIAHAAGRLNEEVRGRFPPSAIYGEILSHVDRSLSVQAA